MFQKIKFYFYKNGIIRKINKEAILDEINSAYHESFIVNFEELLKTETMRKESLDRRFEEIKDSHIREEREERNNLVEEIKNLQDKIRGFKNQIEEIKLEVAKQRHHAFQLREKANFIMNYGN